MKEVQSLSHFFPSKRLIKQTNEIQTLWPNGICRKNSSRDLSRSTSLNIDKITITHFRTSARFWQFCSKCKKNKKFQFEAPFTARQLSCNTSMEENKPIVAEKQEGIGIYHNYYRFSE